MPKVRSAQRNESAKQSVSFLGLSLPEKRNFSSILSKLPFTSSEPDTTVIIERKQGLEKYLQVRVIVFSLDMGYSHHNENEVSGYIIIYSLRSLSAPPKSYSTIYFCL